MYFYMWRIVVFLFTPAFLGLMYFEYWCIRLEHGKVWAGAYLVVVKAYLEVAIAEGNRKARE